MSVGDERAVVGCPGNPGEAQAVRRLQRERFFPVSVAASTRPTGAVVSPNDWLNVR
jgi:hypothetical protein